MKLSHLIAIPVGLIAAALTFCVNACDRQNVQNTNREEIKDTTADTPKASDAAALKDDITNETPDAPPSAQQPDAKDSVIASEDAMTILLNQLNPPDDEVLTWYGPSIQDVKGRTLDDYGIPKLSAEPLPKNIGGTLYGPITKFKFVAISQPMIVSDSMDSNIVRKVVEQHFGEIQACYESNKTKGGMGKVTVVWLIDDKGSVPKALIKETTLKNKTVESCIIDAVKQWRFPAPKDGGMVQVELPFEFACVGGCPE